MSFSLPKSVPSFDDSQREYENVYWSRFRNGERVGNAVGGLFQSQELPMYKDKPYRYPPPMRRPIWKQKRVLIGAAMVLLLATWTLSSPKSTKSGTRFAPWNWIKRSKSPQEIWAERMEAVKTAFELSWDGYEQYAWGEDEFHPITKTGSSITQGGMGYIIVDALDSLIIMNSTSRLSRARDWISQSLSFDKNAEVSSFHTTSKVLGGLLSAHYLSTEVQGLAVLGKDNNNEHAEDLYIEKATDLADRLLGAFDSPSKVPYPQIHLETRIGTVSANDEDTTITGRASGMQLEFRYMAMLLGEKLFWGAMEKNLQRLNAQAESGGLVSGLVIPASGAFVGSHAVLSASNIPYYENLLKEYLQTTQQELIYREIWDDALSSIRSKLTAYSETALLTVLGERSSDDFVVLVDEATCKLPGLIALASTGGHTLAHAKNSKSWSPTKDNEISFSKELMKSCWALHKASPTGIAASRSHVRVKTDPSPGEPGVYPSKKLDWETSSEPAVDWRADISFDENYAQNDQDAAFVESLFYLWRITEDEIYRDWGWELFSSYVNSTSTLSKDGFVSLSSVLDPLKQKDEMNPLWLSRTLKFFYLLLAPVDFLPLNKYVFTTTGHLFPRFKLTRGLKTGDWAKQARRADKE